MITEKIIINFFEGKCDARDGAIVQAWLDENPAKLKEWIGEAEWDDYQPTQVLSPDISDKLWNNIKKGTASPKVYHPRLRWMAVAASLLLAIGLSWQFMVKQTRTGIPAKAVATTRNIFNNTSQKMAFILSDGSTVELSPNSTLSYGEGFNSSKREVMLNGEANFNIAKDVEKPFFVYSNSVLVTVLGTRFTVSSYEANSGTKIVLHEGRVMVQMSDSSFRSGKNEYYLSPGDIFIFKKENRRPRNVNREPVAGTKEISIDSLAGHVLPLEKDKDDRYVFDNYPLDVVFDQLQVIYNARIIYEKAELGNRSFIGKIDKKDSLYHILKSITLLTNFDLHQQGDSFIISSANPH